MSGRGWGPGVGGDELKEHDLCCDASIPYSLACIEHEPEGFELNKPSFVGIGVVTFKMSCLCLSLE